MKQDLIYHSISHKIGNICAFFLALGSQKRNRILFQICVFSLIFKTKSNSFMQVLLFIQLVPWNIRTYIVCISLKNSLMLEIIYSWHTVKLIWEEYHSSIHFPGMVDRFFKKDGILGLDWEMENPPSYILNIGDKPLQTSR